MKNMIWILKMDKELAKGSLTRLNDYVKDSKQFAQPGGIESNFPKHTKYYIKKDLYAILLKS